MKKLAALLIALLAVIASQTSAHAGDERKPNVVIVAI